MADEESLSDYPAVLVNVVRKYEATGLVLCRATEEEMAVMWRNSFELPAPMGMREASCFVESLPGINVYFQPHLEESTRFSISGLWISLGERWFILIEADRPDPSKIKILIHEVTEKVVHISHLLHPDVPERTQKEREKYATRVACYVKMPPDQFRQQVSQVQLDIEVLKRQNDETLDCVARHITDLIMRGQVYCYTRFDMASYGLKHDKRLGQVAELLGGACVRVADVTRTRRVNIRRPAGGGLPDYNLPAFDHYRILNPMMNEYIAANRPVFIETLAGGASDRYHHGDLFGETDLSVLLVPYGIRKTRGFWMVAVHPRDRFRLEHILSRLQPDQRGVLDWLFSNYSYTHKRPVTRPEQPELTGTDEAGRVCGLGDAPPDLGGLFDRQFGRQPYLGFKTQSSSPPDAPIDDRPSVDEAA